MSVILAICVLNDRLFIRCLLSLILVCTVLTKVNTFSARSKIVLRPQYKAWVKWIGQEELVQGMQYIENAICIGCVNMSLVLNVLPVSNFIILTEIFISFSFFFNLKILILIK